MALGFLAGILTFVPYIGAVASAIPSVLLAASANLDMALYVIVLYIGVHLVESYVLIPMVQRQVVHLPPGADVVGTNHSRGLAGFLGLLLATPLVAAALVMIRILHTEDLLGDRTTTEPAPFEDRPPKDIPANGAPGSPAS